MKTALILFLALFSYLPRLSAQTPQRPSLSQEKIAALFLSNLNSLSLKEENSSLNSDKKVQTALAKALVEYHKSVSVTASCKTINKSELCRFMVTAAPDPETGEESQAGVWFDFELEYRQGQPLIKDNKVSIHYGG